MAPQSPPTPLSPSASPQRAPAVLEGALLGMTCGLGAFGWEEVANFATSQPPLDLLDLLDVAWRYALPGLVAGGVLGGWLRERGAVVLSVVAAMVAFVAGGILANLSLWGKLGHGAAALVGFGVMGAAASGAVGLVLRLTRRAVHWRLTAALFALLFVPCFRAVNINAFGSASDRGALYADGAILLLAAIAALLLTVPRALRPRGRVVVLGVGLSPWLVVLPAWVSADDGPPAPAPAMAGRPDILLVVIDTLRADHLGIYGYQRPISPNIDAWAAKGALYTAAQSSAGWTLPAFASLHSGLYPYRHGSGVNPKDSNTQAPLAPEVQTLAEAMAAAGYRTGALVSNPYLKRSFQHDQGFDTYDDALGLGHTPMIVHPLSQLGVPFRGGRTYYRPADKMVDAGLEWWSATEGGPRFLMLHLMDPHDPYVIPEAALAEVAAMAPKPTEPAVDLYDSEIRFADRELARMLDAVGPNTWVFLTADHGEDFGDHPDPYPGDRWPPTRHGHTLYQELLRVPLVVVGPGVAPAVVDRVVRSFDVAATIAKLGGAQGFGSDEQAHDGRAVDSVVLPEVVGTAAVADARPAGSQAILYGTEKLAVRVGDWKLIRTHWGDELYDLDLDPAEAHNLAASTPDRVNQLAGSLPGTSTGVAAEIDDATRKQLESLGYVH
jgi:arylsulfatase A-like enzyme